MPSLPQLFLNSLKGLEHLDVEAFQNVHESTQPPTSIRLNPFKPGLPDFQLTEPVSWNKYGYYLEARPSFTLDPLFHAGCYYVQEAGSMFLESALTQCVDFNQELRILDLCAAPGGKSTLVNSLMNEQSLLVSNEIIASRSATLAHNLSKWGTSNTLVTNSDPASFARTEGFFDVLIVDTPCSGSGLFRKQASAIEEWSLDNVSHCSSRQKEILSHALACLKENGILFYSTCSYSYEENEHIVSWLLNGFDMELVTLNYDKNSGIVETELGLRFYPHLVKSEGFFCSVLRKKTGAFLTQKTKAKNHLRLTPSELEKVEKYINHSEPCFIKKNNRYHLLNRSAEHFFLEHEKSFYFKKAGVSLGEIKGRDFVPDHELALTFYLNMEVDRIELELEEALKFLRKESFIPRSQKKGWVLFTFKKQGLGWAKILPNRLNNYLPSELRILK